MRRELGQLGLADGLVDGGAGRNRQLERITALVDWAAFERLVGEVYAAPVGRPSSGPVVLLSACCCSSGTGCRTRASRRRSPTGSAAAASSGWRWPTRCPPMRPWRAFAAS
jgi:hypothetical protein